jgi:hypothetical protein
MSRLARKAVSALMALGAFGLTGTALAADGAKDKPSVSRAALYKAIQALDAPEYKGGHINEIGPTKAYLPYDYYDTCSDAIDLLIKTREDVDGDLLDAAASAKELRVRYRAARILAERGNRAVVPLLERMCESKDDAERYLAWGAYEKAMADGKLPSPRDFSDQLALYAAEKDKEVREQIERFFGAARAKEAVKPLLETVKRNPGWAMSALWALGEIGDASVVPAIIADVGEGSNNHYHMEALGNLATPEAVDYLIDHLDVYGAVEALRASGSKKALPALKKHLERLREKNTKAGDLDLIHSPVGAVR